MTSDLIGLERDVWRTAGSLIATHGENAPLFALQSVDLRVERGDLQGAAQWRLVWQAAVELLRSDIVSVRQVN
jgi:hypothetical protein